MKIWYLAVSGTYSCYCYFYKKPITRIPAYEPPGIPDIYHETDNAYPEQTTASTIVQELGYLPLALDQAGAYIHIAQYSLGRYLKEYKTNAGYLLSKRWKGGKQDQDRSVFATWEISFNAIQQKSPNAARLLLICGFLNNDDIWEELLKRGMPLEAHGMGCLFYYFI